MATQVNDEPNEVRCTPEEVIHYELKIALRKLSDEEIFAMWQHVCAEHFHPDTEFKIFNLEGKLSSDEFMAVLLEEVDERSRKQRLQPEPA